MEATAHEYPATVQVTNEFGQQPAGCQTSVFAFGINKAEREEIIGQFIGRKFGGTTNANLPTTNHSGQDSLLAEMKWVQRLLGSITILSAVEKHDPKGFLELYVKAREGDKVRIYAEKRVLDETGNIITVDNHVEVIAAALIAQF